MCAVKGAVQEFQVVAGLLSLLTLEGNERLDVVVNSLNQQMNCGAEMAVWQEVCTLLAYYTT